MKKLIGYNEIEDALKRLDRLTQEEARMAVAQILDGVDRIKRSWFPNRIHAGHAGSIMLTGNQLLQELRRWLAPPDSSTNHVVACSTYHKGTANWFFEGRTYKDWKSTGFESLLWIHGKRVPLSHSAARGHPITSLICF